MRDEVCGEKKSKPDDLVEADVARGVGEAARLLRVDGRSPLHLQDTATGQDTVTCQDTATQ